MHRSLSYYTLSKPQSHAANQLDLVGLSTDHLPMDGAARASSGSLGLASSSKMPGHSAGMPRSISLQKLAGGSPAHHQYSHHTHHAPLPLSFFAQQSPGGVGGVRRPIRQSSSTVELVEEFDTPAAASGSASISAAQPIRSSSNENLSSSGGRRTRSGPTATVESDREDDDVLADSTGILFAHSNSPASGTHHHRRLSHLSPEPVGEGECMQAASTSPPEFRSGGSKPISIGGGGGASGGNAIKAASTGPQSHHFLSPTGDSSSDVSASSAASSDGGLPRAPHNSVHSSSPSSVIPTRTGNALVHQPGSILLGTSADDADGYGSSGAGSFSSSSLLTSVGLPLSSSLPASLIDDFDIVGRAGGDSTCDSWIVRSKFSGKMAVFKPREGEAFEEKKKWEQEEEEREERERRRRRAAMMTTKANGTGGAGGNVGGVAGSSVVDTLSTSCPLPNPLSLPPHLRTPVKRGVLYGETTRKEVAAYLMDHEHFAGVPKTLEATIWLSAHEAPLAQGKAMSVQAEHPYGQQVARHAHGQAKQRHAQGLLALGASTSPDMAPAVHPSQQRLLLHAATASPPMGAAAAPQFAFDPEEVWMGEAAARRSSDDGLERSLFGSSARRSGGTEEDDYGAQIRNVRLAPPALLPPSEQPSNLHPPPTLFDSPTAGSGHGASAELQQTHSPDLQPIATAGSTPDELGASMGLGLGLPSTPQDLIATYGSLQEYVENGGSAEDMGSNSFSTDEVHRIGILDVRLLNLDRHLGNLLVQRGEDGAPHLIPIDHGFILPSYTDLADVHLEWTFWRQCLEPFSNTTLRYIARLDPIADAARLRNLGIRDEALVSMVFSSLLLQHAAREGLTLFHIAQMAQRDGTGEEQSTLETIVARVLGSQQQQQNDVASPQPPTPTHAGEGERPMPQPVAAHDLPAVLEEDQMSAASPSEAGSSRMTSRAAFGSSPPTSPSASVAASEGSVSAPTPVATPAPTGLLTRSNSDGAMALAEALSRQSSAPARVEDEPESRTTSMPARAPSLKIRRTSVADAAKQLIELVDSTATINSPAAVPSAASTYSTGIPAAAAAATASAQQQQQSPVTQEQPLAPPPALLRLGTELTFHNPAVAAAAAASTEGSDGSPSSNGSVPGPEIPVTNGAKLQRLLHITESVIQEELALYRRRHGLVPATPPAPPTPAAKVEPVMVSSPPPTQTVAGFNTTVKPPPRSPLRGPFSPTRSASAEEQQRQGASVSPGSTSSALAASLRRSRSGSTDGPKAGSVISPVIGGSTGRFPVRAMLREQAAAAAAAAAASPTSPPVTSPVTYNTEESSGSAHRRPPSLSAAISPNELITAES